MHMLCSQGTRIVSQRLIQLKPHPKPHIISHITVVFQALLPIFTKSTLVTNVEDKLCW